MGTGTRPSDCDTIRPVTAVDRPPSVDKLARSLASSGLPHPLLVDFAREAIAAGQPDEATQLAEAFRRQLLGRVINATGVLLHTNLGRAPRDSGQGDAQGAGYSNLEFDLSTGQRGSRYAGLGRLLARLCGAEAAMVVNNNAAAVLLSLAALADGRQVVVSRGEAVEIGGGFRVPEVMAQSGARLVDVGTTNRTRRSDYERAIDAPGADVAVVLKIHPSNFRVEGFVEEASVAVLSDLGVPVLADIGSGLLDAACPWLPSGPPAWLADEPAARQTLADGASLVMFSGDKLFGGPQAGIIAGRADLVAACARHPLARALRPGGLVLAALQDTALAYLRRDLAALPFWRMATIDVGVLRRRAADIAANVGGARVVDSEAMPGAGSLPGVTIASAAIELDGDHSVRLRALALPIVARVRDGVTLLDLRTIDSADDAYVASSL